MLFDDLTLQSELRSRVHRRVVEGVYECDIKKMKGKRLKDYQRQYDIHYGVRKKKEDIERKYLEEKEKRQPHIHFFGRVGDVFEARMPNWNTWYAGRLTHKDEVLGTVSMQFDDARLIGTSTAVLEANEDRDHNPLKLVVCVDF